jgi:transcription-repair coupling factor (superfamily II helicase)
MAFAGICSFSVIATITAKHLLAIKTFIRECNLYLINEAIFPETLCGRQGYFFIILLFRK